MKSFPCSSCGACCRNTHLSKETKSMDRGDGCCRNYDDATKLCRIYLDRPEICRVDLQFQITYQKIMIWEDFVQLNLQACKILQKKSP